MSPVSTFHFWNAAEIADSRKSSCYLSATGAGNQLSATEAKSISQGEFSSQSTVTSIKTENWGSGSDRFGFEGSSRVAQTHQDSSPTSIDRSSLLGVTSVAGNSVYGENMFSAGSNTQAEALQTLYLMNPGYGGGYSNATNASNMMLFNGVPGGGHMSPLGNPDQQQHQFVKINHNSSPAMTTEPQLAHQAHMVSMQNAEIGHHPNHSDFYQSRGNPVYNWSGGNGLSFIPPSHVSEDNQAMVKPSSDMSGYGSRSIASLGYHEQASLFPDNVTGHGMHIESLQTSSGAGAGQILSLSLSSQQPAVMQQLQSYGSSQQSYPLQHSDSAPSFFHGSANPGPENGSLNKEVMLLNKCGVSGAYPMQPCDNLLGMGYNNPANGMDNTRQMSMIPGHFGMASFQSKYLRPAQELLNEVVSIGNCLKNTSLKPTKSSPSPQAWIGPGLVNDASLAQEKAIADISNKSIMNWTDKKEGDSIVTAVPIGGTGTEQQQSTLSTVELSAAERQELQAKRAKLIGMRDEVDRRYKQYYHQMQTVVASFEAAAGLGAATTYTALALQTISKHFRCLRDAITGQIQTTCKALGEEDVSGLVKGETSKLRLIGQQLRQQRALRQLGMMQQQAWRPQRGLPEHAVSVLRAWLFEHFLHPYPKDADKILLARQTGLTRNQVSNWFINARVRLWKPMVEEMYLEEVKEAEGQAEKSGKDEGEISEGGTTGIMDGGEMCKPAKQPKLSDESHVDFIEAKNLSRHAPEIDVPTGENLGIMKPKSVQTDTSPLLPPNVSYKADGVDGDGVLDHEIKIRTEDNYREAYGIGQNGFVQTDQLNLSEYGSYQINGMNRYSQEAFPPNYSSSGAVSLTLGLQHCEGSPFSGSQQHYAQNHGNLPPGRQDDDGNGSLEYYTLNDNSYDAFNRKPFPPHMLRRDFVV